MNTVSPGFTSHLVSGITQHKKSLEKVEDRVLVTKEMTTFLEAKKTNPIFGKDNSGSYLSASRKWPTKKNTTPYNQGMKLTIAPEFARRPSQSSVGRMVPETPPNSQAK